MTRFSSTPNTTAVSGDHSDFVFFADLDFVSGHVRVNSSDRQLTISSNIYYPLGTLCGVSVIKESANLVPEQIGLTLSGVDSQYITTTLGEKYHGRSATLYVGWLSDGALVDTPYQVWEGRMDTLTIKTEANASVIELACENRLLLWNRAAGWVYSQEDHQTLMGATTDNFFDQIAVIMNQVIRWGEAIVGGGTSPAYPPDPLTELRGLT